MLACNMHVKGEAADPLFAAQASKRWGRLGAWAGGRAGGCVGPAGVLEAKARSVSEMCRARIALIYPPRPIPPWMRAFWIPEPSLDESEPLQPMSRVASRLVFRGRSSAKVCGRQGVCWGADWWAAGRAPGRLGEDEVLREGSRRTSATLGT